MIQSHEPLAQFLSHLAERDRSVVYLRTDREGRLREKRGDVERYGLADLEVGTPVQSRVAALLGSVPLGGEPGCLPLVELHPGAIVDIHLVPDVRDDWIVLIDSSTEAQRRRAIQQEQHDLALARAKLRRLSAELDSRSVDEVGAGSDARSPGREFDRESGSAPVESPDDSDSELLAYERRLRRLALDLARAEEAERRRIAVGLHDDVGQLLAATRMKVSLLRERASEERVRSLAEEVADLLSSVIRHTRSLTFELGSPLVRDAGLRAGLAKLAADVDERGPFSVTFHAPGEIPEPTEEIRILVYQAVRELLFNATKHSEARRAAVEVAVSAGTIEICVRDDGVGFRPSRLENRDTRGFGLTYLRERLDELNIDFSVRSAPGEGTRARLRIPTD